MTWELVASLAVTLLSAVGGLYVALPYLKPRNAIETRLAALEVANAELKHLVATHEQALVGVSGVRGLPRLGVSR